MSDIVEPLFGPPPAEVPLKDAPLVRVIAQLRFPEILSIEHREVVAPFQQALRATYPILRQEQTASLLLGGVGAVTSARPQLVWRFADRANHWRVSLAPDFLALETTKYLSRTDFLARLRVVAQALTEHIEPSQLDRLGVRYIDRVSGEALREIERLVRPEVRGILGTRAATFATHALSESMFELNDARLLARWGLVPPDATVDPGAIEPTKDSSWILDLDMFSAAPIPFIVDQIIEKARIYAESIYTAFRWAVTDEFLLQYGGQR